MSKCTAQEALDLTREVLDKFGIPALDSNLQMFASFLFELEEES